MLALAVPDTALLPLDHEELYLVFDALDVILSSHDAPTREWLDEIYPDGHTLRHRTQVLRDRIADALP